MFDISLYLANKRILYCAGGASPFIARLFQMGYNVIAIDVSYGSDPELFAEKCEK